MIKCLFKFSKLPINSIPVDTTSSSGNFRELSPFILSAPPAKNFENLWQYSKVYKNQTTTTDSDVLEVVPSKDWYKWRDEGWANPRAVRYPMGKGAIPEFSCWNGKKLGYIEARKQIYIPEYSKNVRTTDSYSDLVILNKKLTSALERRDLILLDYDAYDHRALDMSYEDVINCESRKMGHSFVLAMMLEGLL